MIKEDKAEDLLWQKRLNEPVHFGGFKAMGVLIV